MRKSKVFLNLLMFIGVGVTLLHFFSTPIHADTGTGNWHYAEVVDTWNEVGFTTNGTGDSKYYVVNYAGYSHGVITITTDSDDAFGTVTIYGKTYPYSGKVTTHVETSTRTTWQVRQNTYTPGTGPASYEPPFNLNDTRGSFTYNTHDPKSRFGLNWLGTTSDYVNHTDLDTSTWRPYEKNTYVYLGNITWNYYNDVWYFEIPIGNTNISKEDIHLYMYSTWNNKLNDFDISEDYLFQIKDKLFYYFTLNDTYHVWPYGQGDIYLQVDVDGAYVYSNKFNLYHIQEFTSDWYEYLNYIKTWNYYDNTNKVQQESIHLDNSNSSFNSSSHQMMDLEDQLQGDFNSAIGNITVPDNPFGNMGLMFGNSSRFLVHMFNQLTISNGSPFGTVITFSLILGLALLMIGKKGSK